MAMKGKKRVTSPQGKHGYLTSDEITHGRSLDGNWVFTGGQWHQAMGTQESSLEQPDSTQPQDDGRSLA